MQREQRRQEDQAQFEGVPENLPAPNVGAGQQVKQDVGQINLAGSEAALAQQAQSPESQTGSFAPQSEFAQEDPNQIIDSILGANLNPLSGTVGGDVGATDIALAVNSGIESALNDNLNPLSGTVGGDVSAQDIGAGVGGAIGESLGAGPGGHGPLRDTGRQIGEAIGEAVVPNNLEELLIELVPGIGAVPGVGSAFLKLAARKAILQKMAADGVQNLSRETVQQIVKDTGEKLAAIAARAGDSQLGAAIRMEREFTTTQSFFAGVPIEPPGGSLPSKGKGKPPKEPDALTKALDDSPAGVGDYPPEALPPESVPTPQPATKETLGVKTPSPHLTLGDTVLDTLKAPTRIGVLANEVVTPIMRERARIKRVGTNRSKSPEPRRGVQLLSSGRTSSGE